MQKRYLTRANIFWVDSCYDLHVCQVRLLAVMLQQQSNGSNDHDSSNDDDQRQVLTRLGWRFLENYLNISFGLNDNG